MNPLRPLLAATVALTLGCLGAHRQIPEFQKKGEIYFASRSASFDEYRVVAPLMNMSKREDGTWAGMSQQQIVDVEYANGELRGANISLRVEEHAEGVVVRGYWLGKLLNFEVNNELVMIRAPQRSFTLSRKGENTYGPDGNLRFDGEANHINPPQPQFTLALVAAFAQ
jgi:hypothetical protein